MGTKRPVLAAQHASQSEPLRLPAHMRWDASVLPPLLERTQIRLRHVERGPNAQLTAFLRHIGFGSSMKCETHLNFLCQKLYQNGHAGCGAAWSNVVVDNLSIVNVLSADNRTTDTTLRHQAAAQEQARPPRPSRCGFLVASGHQHRFFAFFVDTIYHCPTVSFFRTVVYLLCHCARVFRATFTPGDLL